jgi:hypothetical protein
MAEANRRDKVSLHIGGIVLFLSGIASQNTVFIAGASGYNHRADIDSEDT